MSETRRKNWYIPVMVVAVLLCVALGSRGIGSGYARYATGDSGSDGGRVAMFAFDPGTTTALDLSGIVKPGDSKTYTFTVANHYGSGAVSEVSEQYMVTMSLNGSMPLTVTLTPTGGSSLSAEAEGGDLPVIRSSDGTFSASVRGDQAYTLKVEWPAERNSIEYASAGTVSKLELTIVGVQVD